MTESERHAFQHALIHHRMANDDDRRTWVTLVGHLVGAHGWKSTGPPKPVAELESIHDDFHGGVVFYVS